MIVPGADKVTLDLHQELKIAFPFILNIYKNIWAECFEMVTDHVYEMNSYN